ncbi:hypothetical protein AB0E62_35845 [Streptomyces sp. NPDC038707]
MTSSSFSHWLPESATSEACGEFHHADQQLVDRFEELAAPR